ncbi:GIY-YIG nuclease family protein [Rhizobium leguminosarum]|uniref:GIY-YIG nuclease family protein n=1 Tax=Rhizobium leguminosarum TaxID=384 RepID=UPI001C91160F|nr:GIY-YIG nuclease family protein [Rhizobium leguminosarum]MBY2986405.1 GIY-YIG nuclease family protein [Rhizobium leguminosarum]
MSVYFMQEQGGEGLIKIGFSDLPDRRLTTVRRGEKNPVQILAVIDGGREVERMLHAQLAVDRARGEWFRPSEAVMGMVQTAQSVSSPRRHKSSNVTYDETAEDMRIVHGLITQALFYLDEGQSKFAALENIVFPRLHDINPMWTARRLRGLYGNENSNIPHWVVRNLTELVEGLRDKAAGLAEWVCPEIKED